MFRLGALALEYFGYIIYGSQVSTVSFSLYHLPCILVLRSTHSLPSIVIAQYLIDGTRFCETRRVLNNL